MNLSNASARARYWRDTERRRKAWIVRETNKAARRFDEEGQYIRHLFVFAGMEAALLGITAQSDHWNAYLTSLYLVVAGDFGNRFFDSVSASLPTDSEAERSRQDQQRGALLHSALLAWLFNQSPKKAREIADTSRSGIESTLNEGIAAGEAKPQLAARITNQYQHWAQVRSRTIAQTEVVAASNLGTHEAAQTTVATLNLTLSKVWVAVQDNRTRPWHRAADGQKRGLDEYFQVEGEELLYPGDWAHGASPDNLINCRCTVGYQVATAQQRRAA